MTRRKISHVLFSAIHQEILYHPEVLEHVLRVINISSVCECMSVWASFLFLSSVFSSILPVVFVAPFFFIPPLPIHMMQGGMRATEVGCVTIATSWLTGRTVPLFFESQGDQQWIQPLSCDGSVYLLILGGQETPLLWANRCSILRPGVADDGEKGGGEGDHGCFWFLL